MAEDMEVREAGEEDLEELLSILEIVAEEMLERGNDSWKAYMSTDDDHPFITEKVREDVQKGAVYLLYVGDHLAGTMTLSTDAPFYFDGVTVPSQDGAPLSSLWSTPDERATYMSRLAIIPDYRKGEGSGKLIEHAVATSQAHGATTIRIDVSAGAPGLERLYKHHGWIARGLAQTRRGKDIIAYERAI